MSPLHRFQSRSPTRARSNPKHEYPASIPRNRRLHEDSSIAIHRTKPVGFIHIAEERLRRRAGEGRKEIRCSCCCGGTFLCLSFCSLVTKALSLLDAIARGWYGWSERSEAGADPPRFRGVERSGPWRNEALGRGRAWSGSEAELPCERRRGREIERALGLAARADDGNFSAARPAVLAAHWSGSRGNRWLPPGRQDLFRWHRVF